MKSLFVLALLLLASSARADIVSITVNNAKVVTKNFNKKLLKGSLDKKGYGALRERIGPMDPGESLEASDPVYIEGEIRKGNSHDIPTSKWFVPVYRVNSQTQSIVFVYNAYVICKIYRYPQNSRFHHSSYWDPECKVVSVDEPQVKRGY